VNKLNFILWMSMLTEGHDDHSGFYITWESKFHPRIRYEGPEWENTYSSTLSLTSAVDGVGGQRHAPAALPSGRNRYPLYKRLCRPLGRSGRVWKPPSPKVFDPRNVQSLYRLRYPGHTWECSSLYKIKRSPSARS